MPGELAVHGGRKGWVHPTWLGLVPLVSIRADGQLEELSPKPDTCWWEVVPLSSAAVNPALGHSELHLSSALGAFHTVTHPGPLRLGIVPGLGPRKPDREGEEPTPLTVQGMEESGSGAVLSPCSLLQKLGHVCVCVHFCVRACVCVHSKKELVRVIRVIGPNSMFLLEKQIRVHV